MLPAPASLGCLGFLFVQRIWAQVGAHGRLNISAWPSAVVPLREHVALLCHSHLGFAMFGLCKEDGTHIPELQHRFFQKSLLVGPVTPAHAGAYRCLGYYSQSTSVRSASSDPLQIMVTGLYMKPTLSSQPGPTVMSGENVTLSCSSEHSFDMYHLSREMETHVPQLTAVQRRSGAFQADFPLGPVTPAHGGTYRCYGSLNHSPYEWSEPSDPLHILVIGKSTSTYPPTMKPVSERGNSRRLHVLIGPSVAILFLTTFLYFLVHRWCPARESAAVMASESEVDGRVDGEDPEAEHPQALTYTELGRVLTQKKTTPTSQRHKDNAADSSTYVELALPEPVQARLTAPEPTERPEAVPL